MNIPFTKFNNFGVLISSVLILISVLSMLFKGLTLGLDFTGGVSLEISMNKKLILKEYVQAFLKLRIQILLF